MDLNDPQNLRGFTDHFAEEFVVPQISFWLKNVFQKPSNISGLEKEYYDGMENAVDDLKRKFSPPYKYHSRFPLHEVVINIEEVERLKGIIGDNYRFLKKQLQNKKNLGVSFVDTKNEEKELENLDLYLNHIVPNFQDSLSRSFFLPFGAISNTKKVIDSKVIGSQERSGIFLCHSSKDKEIVRWFRNSFEDERIKVWFDESEIFPGDSIPRKIAKGMEKARFVALFVSENLNLENMSQSVGWELSMAKTKDLEDDEGRLIPIMIGRSSGGIKLPQEVIDKNYADFRDKESLTKDDPEFLRILKKIKGGKMNNGPIKN